MAKVTRDACDVFNHEEWPQAAFDHVEIIEIKITIGIGDDDVLLKRRLTMCYKARERLLNGIERLLKPPAKRKAKNSATV